jgi:hypothetical protein
MCDWFWCPSLISQLKTRKYGNFMQDIATAQTAKQFCECVSWSFGERVVSIVAYSLTRFKSLWLYLWGTLGDKVYVNNSHPLRDPKRNTGQEISIIPRQKFPRVCRNFFFWRREACAETEGRWFETLFWTNAGPFFFVRHHSGVLFFTYVLLLPQTNKIITHDLQCNIADMFP